jgi:hypothetical protein
MSSILSDTGELQANAPGGWAMMSCDRSSACASPLIPKRQPLAGSALCRHAFRHVSRLRYSGVGSAKEVIVTLRPAIWGSLRIHYADNPKNVELVATN